MTESRDYLDDRWKLEIERRRLHQGLLPGERSVGIGRWRYEIVCASPARDVLDRVLQLAKIVNATMLSGNWPSLSEWERSLPSWLLAACFPISGAVYERQRRDFETMPYAAFCEKYESSPPFLDVWLRTYETTVDEQGRLGSGKMWYWYDASVTGGFTVEAFVDASDIYVPDDFPWMFQVAGAKTVHGGADDGTTGWMEF